MGDRNRDAEGCLVAICAHLSMASSQDDSFAMWLDCLDQVLGDCEKCSGALAPIRTAANMLVVNKADFSLVNHWLSLLRLEVQGYYRLTAARRFEVWQGRYADDVIEGAA